MNRLTIAKSLIFGCLFVINCPVYSASAEAGKEKSAVCQGCHGEDGNSLGPDWPHLAGQNANYLRKQIGNFQKSERTNEIMNGMVAGLSEEDVADIAAYFSSHKIQPQATDIASETINSGRKIYKGGNRYSGVPACAGCHGPNAVGNGPAAFPHLAGQRVEYLVKTLNDFKTGQRANDPNEIMRNIAEKMTEKEINSVAAYITSITE